MADESKKTLEMRVAELEDKLSKLQAGTQASAMYYPCFCVYCYCYHCYNCRCWTECSGCGQPCGGPCIQQQAAMPSAFGKFGM